MVDWAFKLKELEKSPDTFESKFGFRITSFMFMLVAGRDNFIDKFDKTRLNWRWNKVIIDSQQIRCLTFDQMLTELDFAVETYPTAAEIDAIRNRKASHR